MTNKEIAEKLIKRSEKHISIEEFTNEIEKALDEKDKEIEMLKRMKGNWPKGGEMMNSENARDCKHGNLKRECDICLYEKEIKEEDAAIKELNARLEEARTIAIENKVNVDLLKSTYSTMLEENIKLKEEISMKDRDETKRDNLGLTRKYQELREDAEKLAMVLSKSLKIGHELACTTQYYIESKNTIIKEALSEYREKYKGEK